MLQRAIERSLAVRELPPKQQHYCKRCKKYVFEVDYKTEVIKSSPQFAINLERFSKKGAKVDNSDIRLPQTINLVTLKNPATSLEIKRLFVDDSKFLADPVKPEQADDPIGLRKLEEERREKQRGLYKKKADLIENLIGFNEYQLTAVICHKGSQVGPGGQYTSFVRRNVHEKLLY